MNSADTEPDEQAMVTVPAGGTASAQDYRAKATALHDLVDGASAAQWEQDSPCAGWTAADVLDHLMTTQREFLEGLETAVEAADSQASPAERWSRHTQQVGRLLDDPQVADHTYDGYFGPTTVGATMAQFYGWDMLAHRYDLGAAMGRDPMLTPGELDEIEAALPMFGEALRAPGICGPEVEVGPDASRLVRVMALLGRDAR